MADAYQNMTILTPGREFENQWERVNVPVIESKYKNMRNNVGNDVRETYIHVSNMIELIKSFGLLSTTVSQCCV